MYNTENRLFTLDASESFNPNREPTENSDDVKPIWYLTYTWKCNITKDDNCKSITTKGTLYMVNLYKHFITV